MAIQRFLFNIASDQIELTAGFYCEVFGFKVILRNEDWYIQLASPLNQNLQFGVIRRNHTFLPTHLQALPQGVIFTIQVDDVEAIHKTIVERGHPIVQDIRDEDFGQRHFLMRDPNGFIVNVSMPIPMSGRFESSKRSGIRRMNKRIS